MREWNEKNIDKAIYNAFEAEETKTVRINDPDGYSIRKTKTEKYPKGIYL